MNMNSLRRLLLVCVWAFSCVVVFQGKADRISRNDLDGVDATNVVPTRNYGKTSFMNIPLKRELYHYERKGHVFAVVSVEDTEEADTCFLGASAVLNVWKPTLDDPTRDYSRALVWAFSGQKTKESSIQVGWQVWPQRYGNDKPHMFVYMTNDSFNKVNCYDEDRHGAFIRDENFNGMGKELQYSTTDGTQTEHSFTLEMDDAGDWSFKFDGVKVGKWSRSVLPQMQRCAWNVEFGGEVTTFDSTKFPDHQMGSGVFPHDHPRDSGMGKVAYFRELKVKGNTATSTFQYPTGMQKRMSKPDCYNIGFGPHAVDYANGLKFFFGGPGGKARYCEKNPIYR